MKVEESFNVIFDESLPPSKLSSLVYDDVGEEEAVENNIKVVNNNNIKDESVEVDEVFKIKEFKNYPLEQVIGNLNQRTLRSQAQNQSNLFYFISTIEPKNVNEALGDESWFVAMQEALNQFIANGVWDLVPLHKNQSIIETKLVYRNKLDENGDLKFFLGLQIKQMEDGIFFNQSKYIKEMLKKFRLEDSKPTKTPVSTEIKLTKDDEAYSVDSTKCQGTGMETIVYADSDHATTLIERALVEFVHSWDVV
ncbi:retrovirus-related pol polyprotein from transposon TNT 1-94 [Tanacetum coccineum]